MQHAPIIAVAFLVIGSACLGRATAFRFSRDSRADAAVWCGLAVTHFVAAAVSMYLFSGGTS